MIIDSHAHLLEQKNFDTKTIKEVSATFPTPADTDLDSLVNWMKEAGVKKAVIMGQDMSRIWNSSCGEDYILESYKKYPDFFIPLASVEPIDKVGRFNKSALEYFEKAIKEYGFRGLLLTPPFGHYKADDPQVYPFYEKAIELDVLVQFHCCTQICPPILAPFKYSRPESLNNVIVDFPELKIVVEHLNYPWHDELFLMMASDPNICSDLAMLYSRPMSLAWNLVKAKEFGVIDRIMYASDYWDASYLPEKMSENMKKSIKLIKSGLNEICTNSGWPTLDSEEIEGILWKNANRLFNLGF